MELYTEAELALAEEIKQNSQRLVMASLTGNDILLYKMLNDMIMLTNPRLNDKIKNRRRQYESICNERLSKDVVDKIAAALRDNNKSTIKVAQNLLNLSTARGDIVRYFKQIVDVIKNKLGIIESLDTTKNYLRKMLNEEDPRGEKKPQDIADILYHLDVATRHIDALVGYNLVASHANEVVSISSSMQHLAQRIRDELGAEERVVPDDVDQVQQEPVQKKTLKPNVKSEV